SFFFSLSSVPPRSILSPYTPLFRSQLTGLAKTDWSWSALFSDFDNDGMRDLYVTNGIRRDLMDGDVKQRLKEFVEENRDNYKTRSEEHTSELQSRENLVCRLLLEKK